MPIEKAPKLPLPAAYVPSGGVAYKVKDNDSWVSIAKRQGVDVWNLIEFNFKTRNPDEVNWYLRHRVGCKKTTADGKNWMFSSDAKPGIIHLPAGKKAPAKKEAPTDTCSEELASAKGTLEKSREVADTIVGRGATSDMPYWFARLYQYITLYEIEDRGKLTHPCFVLHFIPIFYDTYFVAVDAFKKKSGIPSHWQDHFTLAGLYVDPSQLFPYAASVTKSLITGVTAHIKGDMAPSLEKAYRSFRDKYTGVPPFDTYKLDFFERNRPIFEKVRNTLVNELVNRGMGMAAMGKSVDPNLASKAADEVKMGLDIGEIYKWREEAWKTAKTNLGQ
jgi:hypothetical protein